MALQAFFAPNELRLLHFVLIQRVKHGSLGRVNRCDFQKSPALHPPDVNIVVEVNGSRRGRPDPLHLGTRLRKNEPLRGKRDVEFVEN